MAKKKGAKKETKSDFLRKVLTRNPDLDYHQVNRGGPRRGTPGRSATPCTTWSGRSWGSRRNGPGSRRTRRIPPRSTSAGATGEVYQFKITLMDTKPPIWRRIQVSDCTLDKLHEHIQTAMGWTNSHLHHFRIDGKLYGDPMLMAETFEELNYADSTTTRLSDILPASGKRSRFEYEYDFGDGWQHEVLFEGRLAGRAWEAVSALPGGSTGLPARGRGRRLGVRGLPRSHRRPRGRAARRDAGVDRPASSTPRRSTRRRRPGG